MRGTEAHYKPFPAFAEWAPEFDPSVTDHFASLLEASKASATKEVLSRAVEVATRYAAVDTGAIEGLYTTNRGFTTTIATQAATWEAALRQHPVHVESSINDALRAYEMVLDAATGATPLSESWVRQLHEVLCASQETYDVVTDLGVQAQPLPKGRYKLKPNNPTSADTGRIHHYAPVSDTPSEMQRLLAELRSTTFTRAHPVVQAAYAHYGLVRIHPFADGNGRVARALASLYLYRRPGVPLVVFADQKDVYIDALELADTGKPRAFVAFMTERTIDTIELVRTNLQTGSASLESSLASLRDDLVGRGGLGHSEYDAINSRLGQLLSAQIAEQLDALELPTGVTAQLQSTLPGHSGEAPEGFRRSPVTLITYLLRSEGPAVVGSAPSLYVWSAKPGGAGADFLVTAPSFDRTLEIFLRDVHPQETAFLGVKLNGWFAGVLAEHVRVFSQDVHRALIASGYRQAE